jgi:HEAT repeat protein
VIGEASSIVRQVPDTVVKQMSDTRVQARVLTTTSKALRERRNTSAPPVSNGKAGARASQARTRSAARRLVLSAFLCTGVLTLVLEPVVARATGSATPNELQRLFEQQEYQKMVEEIARLGSERSALPDIRRLKIRGLLKLGNPKEALAEYDRLEVTLQQDDVSLLREISLGFVLVMMKDMREQMRGVAYTALKEWHSPEAIPFLEDGLGDGSGLVRALAAEGLAKLEAGRRSTRFRGALEDQAVLVKEAVLKGLAKSGDASVVALIEPVLKDLDPRVRVAAAEALCGLKRQDGCDLLTQSGMAPNPDERTSAIRALVDLQGAQALPVLLEASAHKQPSVRGAAATGFAHMPKAEALGALRRLLKDLLPPVRIAAAVSLGQLQGQDAVSALREAIGDRDASVRAFVVGALLEQGEGFEALAAPIATLSSATEPAVRTALARALGHASEGNRAPARARLAALVEDPMPRVRIAALKSMAKLEGMSALPFLKGGLHDEDDAVRAAAGGTLLHIVVLKK